jgi:hypothetical protein
MFTIILYLLAITFLVISFFKDKKKTKMALIKAWKAFENTFFNLAFSFASSL